MSLDVWLNGPAEEVDCACSECGHVHKRKHRETFFEANITHNLNRMAEAAGVYDACWHPEAIGATKAGQLIERLTKGLADLKARPGHFELFNAKNGWGLYKHFVPWVERYLEACKAYPDAEISVSR
jgi:hypothetical protein